MHTAGVRRTTGAGTSRTASRAAEAARRRRSVDCTPLAGVGRDTRRCPEDEEEMEASAPAARTSVHSTSGAGLKSDN